jgi:hypothetical protein
MRSQRGEVDLSPFRSLFHSSIDFTVAGQIEKTYSCCGSNSSGIGCAVSQYHVSNGDDTQLLPGYVKTRPLQKPLGKDESYGIFALDCEMVGRCVRRHPAETRMCRLFSVTRSMALNLFVSV